MITALALVLALQVAPAVDGPKTKLGLPADTRPIGDVIREAFPEPVGFAGAPATLADAKYQSCKMADRYLRLATEIKQAKINGEVWTSKGDKEFSPEDIRSIDVRLVHVEGMVERHKLGCSQ